MMTATESKTKSAFEIGAQVMLNSGGPTMAVIGISPTGKLWCQWKQRDGTPDDGSFYPAMVKRANRP